MKGDDENVLTENDRTPSDDNRLHDLWPGEPKNKIWTHAKDNKITTTYLYLFHAFKKVKYCKLWLFTVWNLIFFVEISSVLGGIWNLFYIKHVPKVKIEKKRRRKKKEEEEIQEKLINVEIFYILKYAFLQFFFNTYIFITKLLLINVMQKYCTALNKCTLKKTPEIINKM